MVRFRCIAWLTCSQDDAQLSQSKVLPNGFDKGQAGILTFHDDVQQDYGYVLLGSQLLGGLGGRIGVQELEWATQYLDAGKGNVVARGRRARRQLSSSARPILQRRLHRTRLPGNAAYQYRYAFNLQVIVFANIVHHQNGKCLQISKTLKTNSQCLRQSLGITL